MIVYTLKTCDTCRKALKWLEANDIAFDNHDIRKDGLPKSAVESLIKSLGWEAVVNRKSATWRGLTDGEKSDLDAAKAIDLIVANPTLVKRPAFVTEQEVMVGFGTDVQEWLKS